MLSEHRCFFSLVLGLVFLVSSPRLRAQDPHQSPPRDPRSPAPARPLSAGPEYFQELFESRSVRTPSLDQTARWVGLCYTSANGGPFNASSESTTLRIKVAVKDVLKDGTVVMDKHYFLVREEQFGVREYEMKADPAERGLVLLQTEEQAPFPPRTEKIVLRQGQTSTGSPFLISHTEYECKLTPSHQNDPDAREQFKSIVGKTVKYCIYNIHPGGLTLEHDQANKPW